MHSLKDLIVEVAETETKVCLTDLSSLRILRLTFNCSIEESMASLNTKWVLSDGIREIHIFYKLSTEVITIKSLIE